MPRNNRFIPEKTTSGGTQVGSTYLSDFVRCPYFWFNRYVRPSGNLDEDYELIGLQPKWKDPALGLGSFFHTTLEHLYLSRCRDGEDTGEWSLDFALDALSVSANEQKADYKSAEQWQADLEEVQLLLRYYVDEYGPGRPSAEWPNLQVAFDGEGKPLIEREFILPLGYKDFFVTSKPDLIALDNGYLCTVDHKTAAGRGGWARRRLNNIHSDPQFTMEHMILTELFPEEHIDGSLVNIVAKGLVAHTKSERFLRGKTTRSLTDIDVHKSDTISLLRQIDEGVELFQELWGQTNDIEHSATLAFPRHGQRIDSCHAYNRECLFYDLCVYKDDTEKYLRVFKPRVKKATDNEEASED